MNRVTHFEIYTDDPQAVQPFYQDVFGWKFKKFEGGPIEYWLVTTGDDKEPGINGGMTRPREGQSTGTLNTVAVKSLDQTMKKLEQRGGKICVPKMAIPKVGWLAYAADPAGNVFGVIEPDTNPNKRGEKVMTANTIRLHRVVRATPEKIYKAFLDPDAMAKWLPPNGFTGKVHQMDAKVGGTYKMSFTNFTTGKSHSFGGTYVELTPHERIRYTDKFDDPNLPGEMQTTITLTKVSCGTDLNIVQEGVPGVIPAEACYLGWQESLAQLAKLVEPEIPDQP